MNDDMFEDPNDPRVWSGFAQPPSLPAARSGDGARGETIAGRAAARTPAGARGEWLRSSSESESSWLAAGRALLSDFLAWARHQLRQQLMTMVGLVLAIGLFAVVCANIDNLQALATGGLAGIIPGNMVNSPLEGRNGPRTTSRSPADGSTATASTGTRGVPPVSPSATPGAPAVPGPTPTATPKPARAPTPTAAPPRTLEGNLTVRAPYGASCGGNPCSVLIEAWIGGVNYRCGVYAIKLPYAGSTTVFCRLPNATPSSLPAGAFSGLCAGCGGNRTADIVWTNPSPFYLGS